MEDDSLQKVAISGPILASLIQRFSSSSGAVDGLLFGHVSDVTLLSLSDDSSSSTDTQPSLRVATVTGFLCSGTTNSFYDSLGRVDSQSLNRLLDRHQSDGQAQPHDSFLGWFSGRRRTQLRPSMREYLVSSSLSSMKQLSFPVKDAVNPTNFIPSVFLLLTSPLSDQIIHTHEYRAFQFRSSNEFFEPKSIDIVNIGPAFRGHYGSFIPNSPFPHLPCEMRASPMNEDKNDDNLNMMKQNSKDQKQMNVCAEGFDVGNLTRLLGSEAANYTAGLEDLYEKMLAKTECLARLVEESSAQVLEQENHNRKLRYKVARYPGFE
ncbi:Dehydration-responsive element-binding protein 2A [Cucumis melo var. makuwa]|uniref:Dehydration-responsive element-binding protein 2A n=2 Tax=Cucumis melo TaxID=3656 RepID=A0A5D3CG44_CUCMM|nr:uncharacterized protein LOC103502164 [Cucumis melo]TYK10947.1 Dehydration-responsive element-binding protein 2A [Cucumis melo var. makuwa]